GRASGSRAIPRASRPRRTAACSWPAPRSTVPAARPISAMSFRTGRSRRASATASIPPPSASSREGRDQSWPEGSGMNVLVVFDHPRRHSFCGAVLDAFLAGLAEAGHKAELADLHAEGFDPRMPLEDEPDWADPNKRYSPAVLHEQARIARNDMLA